MTLSKSKEQDVYAIYIRVSSDKQADSGDSIPMQENLGVGIIEKNNGILFKVYIEPAVSASKTKLKDRTILLECLGDAKAGLFNKLIVYRRDRIARKIEDSLAIRSALEQANCELIYSATGEMQSSNNDPYGKMMENIRASLDEIESAQISMRVSDVMRDKAKRGENSGGNLPFGYYRKDEQILLIPEDVEIIKEIEELYLGGYGIHSIVKWLSGEKISNLGARAQGAAFRRKQYKRSSEKWTNDVVKTILYNPFYSGMVLYSTEGDRRLLKPDDVDEKVIRAIGTQEVCRTSKRQQEINRIRDNKKNSVRSPRFYTTSFLLSGIIYCAECGNKYNTRNTTKGNGAQYLYYVCSSKHSHKYENCSSSIFKKEILEEYVLQKIKEDISDIDYSNLTNRIQNGLIESDNVLVNELKEIEKKISRYNKDYTSIRRLLLDLDEEDNNYTLLRDNYQEDQAEILKKINETKIRKSIAEDKMLMQSQKKDATESMIDNFKEFSTMIDTAPFYLKNAC
ncbi:recombinase family protein [Paenibacillus pini]|uniref:Site-specific recombinase n=1 Tax=Paenibacillus pini JCM 16418 TaxID=1236976 RepID=W7YPK3_9BACL|nr:recombinase family protein [Paenibacillus pini]GAF10397.1 hypothetical protein JCM16418_4600 [Paenibacillus pini JCM 16418]